MCRTGFQRILTIAGLVLSLVSCGGGGGTVAGIGGTGITTTGTITGFGSIFVNGIEFETSDAAITVDDNISATENELALGMVVTVTGIQDASGITGTAASVVFDDSIEGPIAGAIIADADGQTKTFTILGQTVIVDRNTTVFDDTSFDTLAENDVLEVSGFVDGGGAINATRVEKKSDFTGSVEVELKGTISNLDTTARSFSIGTTLIVYSTTTVFEDMTEAELINGLVVEAKGTFDGASVDAREIEKEDEGFPDTVNNVSIEGLITDFVSVADFKIQGQAVDATNAVLVPASMVLASGIKVQAEGPIEGGVLMASKVELRSGDLKFETEVLGVDSASGEVTLVYPAAPGTGGVQGTIDIVVTSTTRLEDKTSDDGSLSLSQLMPGNFVKVEALDDGTGSIIATELERDDEDDRLLQGPLDENATQSAPGSIDGSLKILGIVINTSSTEGNNGTEYEDVSDSPITADAFFSSAVAGRLVKVEDSEPGNGIADEAELEN